MQRAIISIKIKNVRGYGTSSIFWRFPSDRMQCINIGDYEESHLSIRPLGRYILNFLIKQYLFKKSTLNKH